jgi:hypothetical protein
MRHPPDMPQLDDDLFTGVVDGLCDRRPGLDMGVGVNARRQRIAAQREKLEAARTENRINVDEYNWLLEDLDWWEIIALPEQLRRIEET